MSIEVKFVSGGKQDTYTVTDQFIAEAAQWARGYTGEMTDIVEQSLDKDIVHEKDLEWDAEVNMNEDDIKKVADAIVSAIEEAKNDGES